MLDDDPEFLNRFDTMPPGKRGNAVHQIASAKTDATVAKGILKLITDFGLTCLLCFLMGVMA